MAAKCQVGTLDPGARITGVHDFPLAIYKIVNMEQLGKGIYLDVDLDYDQTVILVNEKSGRLRRVDDTTECIVLDPKDQWKANINDMTDKTITQPKMDGVRTKGATKMKNFDAIDAKDNIVSAAIDMKDNLVKMKTGQAIISSVRASIKAVPGVPAEAALILDSAYADMIIGAALAVIIPMVSSSPKIISASQAAGFAGTMAAADKLAFIEGFIEKTIGAIPLSIEKALPSKKAE